MAENVVKLEATPFTGGYVYSQDQHVGTVGPHIHVALTNPVGSGRIILLSGVFISSVAASATTTLDPMRGWFATNVSGGTLVAAADIGKIRTTMPNPVGEIRIEGATATLGASWFNSPPILATGAAAPGFIHQIPTTIQAGSLTLLPGESTVLRTADGDTDQRWNISIAWVETYA
ncbi:hypothetical protein SEA_STELLA_44 [Streptomyces phage Stella]|nr:hypothetical protein SEA_STELLA_44 [Streptomyces phage Stella]